MSGCSFYILSFHFNKFVQVETRHSMDETKTHHVYGSGGKTIRNYPSVDFEEKP